MHLKTATEALYSDTIKLRELAQIYGEQTVTLWIEAWLVNLSEFMDFKISEGQSTKTAMLILEEGYMFNLAEITLCFKRIMKLEFYGQFKASVIIGEIKRYRNERGKALTGLGSDEQKRIT